MQSFGVPGMSLKSCSGCMISATLILMLLGSYGCFSEGTRVLAVEVNSNDKRLPSSEASDEYSNKGDTTTLSEDFASFDANEKSRFLQKRQVLTSSVRWVENRVFYYFDSSIEEDAQKIVEKVLGYISARTCIDFYEDPSATNRIRVTKGNVCSSSRGMQKSEQKLSLNETCYNIGGVAHQFMHALGIWHMQTRDDRDRHVRVDLSSKAQSRAGQNYRKLDRTEVINYTPYDYGSVMHYKANSFAESGNSLVPIRKRYLRTIGSPIPSFYDIVMINTHYKCNARCATSQSAICFNDGMPNPRDCSVCLCPFGYGGTYCNRRPAGCGKTLRALPFWRTETISFERFPAHTGQSGFMMCTYWIKAPLNKKIQVRVIEVPTALCGYGCKTNAIEPKVLKDKRATNPRICCPEQLGEILTSKLNPTPIFSYSMDTTSTFTFQYQYI
uniref:Zinc metalloproteinase n=1 Tax=Haemonchus contortus TaxID=6289 RepID=A0A7I4YH77_HAECO